MSPNYGTRLGGERYDTTQDGRSAIPVSAGGGLAVDFDARSDRPIGLPAGAAS